jgi:DNA-binding LacI/PurR family transcriptional regulator
MSPSSRTQKVKSQKNPTVQDVSRLAGVSTATVSRVLADSAAVSDETRQRVSAAIRTLNYQLNRNARNLRKSTTSKIGVLISDIQNPFFGSVVRGIEKVTSEEDFAIILGNSDEDPEREKKLVCMLLEEGVAGIVFVPTNVEPGSYDDLFNSGTPFIVIDRKIQKADVDTVLVDGCSGAESAIEQLINLGHKRIGFVGGLKHLSVMQDRENGYLGTLGKHGLPIVAEYLHYGNNRQDGGYQAMKELLALEMPPTAVLIANNLMTLGGLKAIHESGVKIPQQISLIGFDDMDWAPSLQPPLSVVAQPAYEMGEKAATVLLERIRQPGLPRRQILLKTELIMRESCCSLLDETGSL